MPKYALQPRLYVAIVGVLGNDPRASRGVAFGDFVAALIAMGFVAIPSGNSVEVVLRARAGRVTGKRDLRVHLPADDNAWWAYEYATVADALRDDFNINAKDVIEIPDGEFEGFGFVIPQVD
ncbi:hypothetical protein C8Q73DRAFT_669545 [Cubamyces lactineus]|nr:hypothetical protein C8Q73DRAFT_669545 [Cubamyces lactineus]